MKTRVPARLENRVPLPRTKSSGGSWWLSGLGFILAVEVLFGLRLSAQISRMAIVRNFKVPEFYDTPLRGKGQTNRLKAMLFGDVGQFVTNDIWRITQMRLEHYPPEGDTNLIARAPECLFDRDTSVAWSTGRLEIVGQGAAFFIEGNTGFEARLTNSTLIISNRVRSVFRQDRMNPSPL